MPDSVVRHMNDWGKKSKSEEYGQKFQFLNSPREIYNLVNDELEKVEGLVKDGVPFPDIPE